MPGLLDPTDQGHAQAIPDPRTAAQVQQAQMMQALSGIAGPWTAAQQNAVPGMVNPMSGLPTAQGVAGGVAGGWAHDPLAQATYAGQQQNQNAYGTMDPAKLGLLGAAGFPLFTDPRVVQGHLADMAQSGVPGADDELRKQLMAATARGGSGGGEGGGTSGGGSGGQGQDASGQW